MGRLNVELAFSANTSQAAQQLKSLKTELSSLSNMQVAPNTKTLSGNLIEASNAAVKLRNALDSATNVNTGKLSLSKFNQELKASGMTLADYKQKLSAVGPEGQKAFMSLTNSIMQANTATTTGNKLLANFGQTLANVAKYQISNTVYRGFTSALSSAYNYAKHLNESLNNIRIVTGQSVEQMDKFAVKATQSARALSTTTVDYTNAALIFYQQGLTDKEVEARTNATIKLANVTGDSAAKVSSQMTAIWNNFAKGSDNLEHYADVITALGAATASSSDEIAEGLEKFAATADTVGLSYDYATTALATVVAQTRQSADVVGTAFKTLFSRIQDLKLGETLEDGVDLGQYSKALDTIGVNILDATGEVKQMDDILDDMGSKWDSLSQSTKVATAEAVAGRRQYTQFIALMDNWDEFQKNLVTARTSDGALNEQAKIYEESWEAASKRVKASLEGIYNDLLDDDFFITLTDGMAKFLQSLGDIIKGMGGLKGILPLVTSLILTFAGPQVYEGLAKIGHSLHNMLPSWKTMAESGSGKHGFTKVVTGLARGGYKSVEDREAIGMKEEASMLQSEMYSKDASSVGQTQQSLLERRKTLQDQIDASASRLTEAGRKEIQDMMERNALLDERLVKETESLENANAEAERQKVLLEISQRRRQQDRADKQTNFNDDVKSLRQYGAADRILQNNEERTKLTNTDSNNYATQAAKAKILFNSGALNNFFSARSSGFNTDNVELSKTKFSEYLAALNGTDESKKEEASKNIANFIKRINNELTGFVHRKTDDLSRTVSQAVAEDTGDQATGRLYADAIRQGKQSIEQRMKNDAGARANNIYGNVEEINEAENNFVEENSAAQVAANAQNLPQLQSNGQYDTAELSQYVQLLSQAKIANDEMPESLQNYKAALEEVDAATSKYEQTSKNESATDEQKEQDKKALEQAYEKLAAAQKKVTAEDLKQGQQAAVNKAGESSNVSQQTRNAAKAAAEKLQQDIDQNKAARLAGDAAGDTSKKIEELAYGNQKLGQTALEGVQGLTSLASAINMVKSVGTIWSDDDISVGQKIITTVTTLGMALPMAASGVKALSAAVKGLALAFKISFGEILAIIAAVAAIIAGIIVLIKSVADGYNKDAIAAEKATEEYNRQVEVLKSVKEEYDNLATALDQYTEKQKNIDGLVEGTKKWKEAVQEANLEILELINKYPALGENIENVNGRLKLNEESIETAQKKMEDQYKAQLGLTMNAQVIKANAQAKADRTEVLRDAGFKDFEGELGHTSGDVKLRESAEKLYDTLVKEYQKQGERLLVDDELTNTIHQLSNGNTALEEKFTENIDAIREQIIETGKNTDALVATRQNLIDIYGNKDYQKLGEEGKAYAQAAYESLLDSTSIGYGSRKQTATNELNSTLTEYGTADRAALAAYHLEKILSPNQGKATIDLTGDNTVTLGKYQYRDIWGDMSLYEKTETGWELVDDKKDTRTQESMREELIQALMIEGFDYNATEEERKNKNKDLIATGLDAIEDKDIIDKITTASASPNLDYDFSGLSMAQLKSLDLSKITDQEFRNQLEEAIDRVIDQRPKANIAANEEFKTEESQATFWSEQKGSVMEATGLTLSEMNNYIEKFAEYEDQAEQVAFITARNQAQVEALNSEFESQSKNLTESSRNSTAYSKAMGKMLEAINKTLVGEVELNEEDLYNAALALSDTIGEDIDQVELLKRAAEGSEEAIKALHVAAAQKIVLKMGLEAETEKAILQYISDGELTSKELDQLNAWVEDGYFTTQQLTELLIQLDALINNNDGKISIENLPLNIDKTNLSEIKVGNEAKEYQDEIERYHESTSAIEAQTRAIDRLNKATDKLYGTDKLKAMDQAIVENQKLLKLYQAQQEEAESYLASDQQALAAYGAQFDENGVLTNYTEIYQNAIDEWNKNRNSNNSEENDKKFEKFKTVLGNYEDSLSKVNEAQDQVLETQNAILAQNYEKINYKIEIQTTVKDQEIKLLDYYLNKIDDDSYKVAEAQGLVANKISATIDQTNIYKNAVDELNSEYEQGNISQADYIAGLQTQQDNLLSSAESLQELRDSMMEYYGNTLSFAISEIDKYKTKITNASSALEHFQKVLDLTGLEEDWKKQAIVLEGLISINQDSLESEQATLEMLQKQRESLQQVYDNAVLEEDKKKIQEDIEELDTQIEESQSKIRENVETDLDYLSKKAEILVKDVFSLALEELENLQDNYKHLTDMSNLWLDSVSQVYETNKLLNSVQKEIDKTTNASAKTQYNSFVQQVKQLQQRDKLSKTDLEIAQKQFSVLQARIALEEAQNAKTSVRLERNAEGGFGYVYTADETKVADAEQKLQDAEYQFYNFGVKTLQDNQSKMISEDQDYLKQKSEIWTKWGQGFYASEAERDAELETLEQRHKEKMATYDHDYSAALSSNSLLNQSYWTSFGNTVQSKIDSVNSSIEEASIVINELDKNREQITLLRDAIGADNDQSLATAVGKFTEKAQSAKQALRDDEGNGLIKDMGDLFEKVDDLLEKFTGETGLSQAISNTAASIETMAEKINDVFKNLEKIPDNVSTTIDLNFKPHFGTVPEGSGEEENSKGGSSDFSKKMSRPQAISTVQFFVKNNKLLEGDRARWGEAFDDTALEAWNILTDSEKNAIQGYDTLNPNYNQEYSWLEQNHANARSRYREEQIKIDEKAKSYNNFHFDWLEGNLQLYDHYGKELENYYRNFDTWSGFSGEDITIKNIFRANRSYFAEVKDSSFGDSYTRIFKLTDLLKAAKINDPDIDKYDTGGYTGSWGSDGKLAMLHQKELVLNAGETKNFLAAIDSLRLLTKWLNVQQLQYELQKTNLRPSSINTTRFAPAGLQQKIDINAAFPNATNQYEIEQAFQGLFNRATQYANSNIHFD